MRVDRTFDHMPATIDHDSMSDVPKTNLPSIGSVSEFLGKINSKIAFVRQTCRKKQPEIEGLLNIEEEILDGLELAANDLDVISEQLIKLEI
jgi:hypothetical protein